MNLVDKEVVHGIFGQGNVVSHNENYIRIGFESGVKKFVFPDVFREYLTLKDQETANIINKRLVKLELEHEKEEIELKKQRDLAQERQQILNQKKRITTNKMHPELQSVFWCKAEDEGEVFENWKVFVGNIKSGPRKGQPRRLTRMNPKSACLLTKREPNVLEKDRRIVGVFMVEQGFDGGSWENGYIPAHTKYRLRLSEQETEKMLFWNYYIDKGFPERMTWNSGKQRYFDNIWMAQILHDIVSLRNDPKGQEDAQHFFEYFCTINSINKEELPEPSGALMQSSSKDVQ